MIKNFKEIAAKILNREIQGVFTLNCGYQYSSNLLKLEVDSLDHKTMFYSLDHNTYDLNGHILNCGTEPDSPWAIASFTEFDEKPESITEEDKLIKQELSNPRTFILTYHKIHNGKCISEEKQHFGNVNTARGTMLTDYFEIIDLCDKASWKVESNYLDGPDNAFANIYNPRNSESYIHTWSIHEVKL